MGISMIAGISFQRLAETATGIVLIYTFTTWAYNGLLHPLRKYPGPFICSISRLPYSYALARGQTVNWHQNLHEKYGDVVRIAPNELSYINPRAWEDIYGRMTNDNGLHIKDMRFFSNVDGEERSLIVINDESEHARVRRIFSPAFSDSALKKQEPMFQKHAESMIQMIHQKVDNDAQQKFDMVKVYNFTTFDIMGELAFGSSLNQLETGHYSLWVKSIFDNMKSAALFSILEYHQPLARLARMIIGPFFRKLEEAHDKFSADHVDRRLAGQVDKPDIWQLVLSQSEQNLLCRKEMHANASLFMLAGSETTATLLSGLIYYLLTYPHTHRNLCQEIRSAFKNPEEISFESLTSLEYLNACIQEGLRMYPPVPVGIPRVSPKGGTVVCGKWVPPKVSMHVSQYVCYNSYTNFFNPREFVPERWLGDPEYVDDNRDALQPFSYGPWGCLGKRMALYEIRLLLALLLWHFNLELDDESLNWDDQRVYRLWEKRPLMVRIRSGI